MNIDAVLKTACEICQSNLTTDPNLTTPEHQFQQLLTSEQYARYCEHRDQLLDGIKSGIGPQNLPHQAKLYWDMAKSAIQSCRQAKSSQAKKEASRKAERASEAYEVLESHEQAYFRQPTEYDELTVYGNQVEFTLPLPLKEAFATSRSRAINYAQRCAIEDALRDGAKVDLASAITLGKAKHLLKRIED